jgi:hypothetical protein
MIRSNAILRRVATCLAALAFATTAAACGGDEATAPSPSASSIRINNQTNASAFYIYIKACSASAWGSDRLGADILSAGESESFPVPAGCYDVLAKSDPDLHKQNSWSGVTVHSGSAEELALTEWHDVP